MHSASARISESRASTRRWRRWTLHFRQCKVEALEVRELFSVGPEEQYLVYLINRARHDPVAYQREQGLAVDLSYVAPRPPLAVNDSLFASSEVHAADMARNNYFGHFSPTLNEWPNKMARDAGYPLPYSFRVASGSYSQPDDDNQIESIAAGRTTAVATLNDLIVDQGITPPGHRIQLLGIDDYNSYDREIGVGHALNANTTYQNYWSIHATLRDTTTNFATGVAFNDLNNNQRYDQGEGLAGVTIAANGLTTITNAAGGWSLPLANGSYVVQASGGMFATPSSVPIAVEGSNVEVDFMPPLPTAYVNFTQWTNVNVSIGDVSVQEGAAGVTSAVFAVTLAHAVSQPVTVAYATADGTATLADNDYQPVSGRLTFAPGVVSQTVTVPVNGDSSFEANETFRVNLSLPTIAGIAQGAGVGTILNDDSPPTAPTPPVVTVPGGQLALKNAAKAIDGISIASASGGAASFQLVLGAPHGALTLNAAVAGGLTATEISGNGGSRVLVASTLAKINATLAAGGAVSYRATQDYVGADSVTVAATDQASGSGSNSDTKSVAIAVAAAPPGQNPTNPLDVNDDKIVTPLDVVILINDINANGTRSINPSSAQTYYLDVNGDNSISPLDVILLINSLNAASAKTAAVLSIGAAAKPSDARQAEVTLSPSVLVTSPAAPRALPAATSQSLVSQAVAPVSVAPQRSPVPTASLDEIRANIFSELGRENSTALD